jgi:hypothetical protein
VIIETYNSAEPFAFTFSEPEWLAVIALCPPAAVADLDAERKMLEFVATAYLNLTHHHRVRSKAGFPTKAWQKKHKQLAADLLAGDDLHAELAHADAAVEGWSMIGHMHRGKKDPARDWLCDAALTMWIRLGGSTGISRRKQGSAPPTGAVLDFMTTVISLVMRDDAPGIEAIAKRLWWTRK